MLDTSYVTLLPPSNAGNCFVWLLKLCEILPERLSKRIAWHVARHFGRLVPARQNAIVRVSDVGFFQFQLRDPYWARLVVRNFVYEPEIAHFLTALKGIPFRFLDCGANLGYWSIFCTDGSLSCAWACAVEASPGTYDRLLVNRGLNSNRFETVNRAIFSESGNTVYISQQGDNHAGASVGSVGSPVLTTTIDDLVSSFSSSAGPLVIKLDVEGVEIVALKGAADTLLGDVVVIYEDHGGDPTSSVTDFIINNLGMLVAYYDDDQRPAIIRTAAEATALKRNKKRGYNFFAFSSDSSLRQTMLKGLIVE